MSKSKHSWFEEFQFYPRTHSNSIIANHRKSLIALREWLSCNSQIILAVAEALEFCSTRAKFQRRFAVPVPPRNRKLKPIIEKMLSDLLSVPTTDEEYGDLRGRLVEILVEAIVFPQYSGTKYGSDAHILYRKNVWLTYPADNSGPNLCRTIDVYGVHPSRCVFFECKAHPDLFTDNNIGYLNQLKGLITIHPTVRSIVFGVTLKTPRQIAIISNRIPPHHQPWIRSINQIMEDAL